MKIPKYVLVVDNLGEKKGKLLYNTISGGKWLLGEAEIQKILNDEIELDMIKPLIDSCTVVNEEFDEKEYLEDALESISSTYNLILVTNYSCNMKCPYCFEKGVSDTAKRMNEDDIADILKRIEEKIVNEKKNFIRLTFTGGEPLLNFDFIMRFLEEFVEKIAGKYKINYAIDLITNATLLNKSIIEKLKKYNLIGVQITIDGPERIHNNIRKLKDNTESFKIIMDNVNEISKEVDLVLRTNYSDKNIKYLYEYMECLNENIKDFERISLIFRPVQDCLNSKNTSQVLEVVNKLCEVIDYANKHNIKVNGEEICRSCKIHSTNNDVFAPEGTIYRCYMLVGNEKYSVGNWREGTINQEVFNKFNNAKSWKECLNCSIAALCRGGCSYDALVRTGDFNSIVCNYDCNYEVLNHFLQVKYRL